MRTTSHHRTARLLARLLALVALAACGAAASPARAQTATATLGGSVLDEAGAVLPGVEITVLNLSTALERHATTNGEGVYVIPLLPPGSYNVTAAREGFTTVEHRGVRLSVGDQLSLRIKLKVGEIGETVTVYDHVGAATRESPAVSTVVNRQFVENLPLNGRSFQTLLELAPGTTLTRASFNEQGQFSASGQRANANYFTVDGVSANVGVSAGAAPGQAAAGSLPALTVLGGTNNLVSVESIEEFQIQTSSYAPEHGRTPGAHVSVVTRAGTNEFHGSVFNYFRNDALDATDWFANSRALGQAALRQNDFGGTLGGPVRKDRTFFFASYEGLRLRQPQVALSDVPTLEARAAAPAHLRPFLEAFPRPTGRATAAGFAEFAASYSDRSGFDAASVRVDHTVSERLTLFGRYNYAPSRTTQRGGASVPGFAGQSINNVSRTSLDTETLTAGATFAPAPDVLDELRVNFSRATGTTSLTLDDFGGAAVPPSSLLSPPSVSPESAGFQFALRGGANSAFGVGRNVRNLQRQLNVVNNLSLIRGRHHLKVGADYRRLTPSYGPLRYSQSVVFGDGSATGVVAALTTGRAAQVKVIADDEPRVPVFTNFSAYAQDTTRLTPRLTVTYGLRWELNPPPRERDGRDPFALEGFEGCEGGVVSNICVGRACVCERLRLAERAAPLWRTNYTSFAPRAGVAYLVSPSRGTTLRGGLGVFYDLGTGQAAQAFGSVFPFVKEKTLTNVRFPLDPAQAEPPPVNLDPPFGQVYAFVPDLKLPMTLQWSATVEQPLTPRDALSASYVGARGERLLRQSALVNPNPSFSLVRLTNNSSSSSYHALQLQYARRLAQGLQAHASYTFARSVDDDSDDSSGLLFPGTTDASRDRGPSTFDVRHSLVAAATYNLPNPFGAGGAAGALARGWHLDAIFRARTAAPVNVYVTSGALVGDLVAAQRPDLVEGVPVWLDDPLAPGGRRINPDAFVVIGNGREGTFGRNALRGFGFTQLDASVRRAFRLSERLSLQLRADVFNVFNRPSFGDPVGDLTSPHFGTSRQTLARSLGTGGVNGGLSPLYQVGGPRSVQLAVRLQF
ncbi:MAG TPA: carboxypeptidase regulatory-like domain-containing protein [Pyrinomonadaceae bacterium]|nr:carboxypeptidase regulatory-like domain-containing protein [Pyrinomonadaceae bacterium]